jgi:hypothetical protein
VSLGHHPRLRVIFAFPYLIDPLKDMCVDERIILKIGRRHVRLEETD